MKETFVENEEELFEVSIDVCFSFPAKYRKDGDYLKKMYSLFEDIAMFINEHLTKGDFERRIEELEIEAADADFDPSEFWSVRPKGGEDPQP